MSFESAVDCVENWQEVRLHDCEDDFEFSRAKACQLWVSQFTLYAIKKVGMAPQVRLNVDIHNKYTVMTMDLFSNLPQNGKNDIAVSIGFLNTRIFLPVSETQFDIELPGISDAFKLIGTVVAKTQGIVEFDSPKVMQFEKSIRQNGIDQHTHSGELFA